MSTTTKPRRLNQGYRIAAIQEAQATAGDLIAAAHLLMQAATSHSGVFVREGDDEQLRADVLALVDDARGRLTPSDSNWTELTSSLRPPLPWPGA